MVNLILAEALKRLVRKNKRAGLLVAGSYRDMTSGDFRRMIRVAGSPTGIWVSICKANSKQLILAIRLYQKELDKFIDSFGG